ncbi:uncharacterized protein V6R79_013130 [Siganus canaliculatus]
MEKSLGNLLHVWNGGLNSTQDQTGVVGLGSSYIALGVVAFICVFAVQRNKLGLLFLSRQHGRPLALQSVRSLLIALLVVDFIQIFVTIFYVIDLAEDCVSFGANSCLYVHVVWFLTRDFSVFLHLLTAMESIFYLCDPESRGRYPCIFPVQFALFIIYAIVFILLTSYVVIIMAPVAIGLVLFIIAKNRVSEQFCLVTVWRIPIVIVAVITLLVSYFPSYFIDCLIMTDQVDVASSVYYYLQFGSNIQHFLDAFLCFFILKLPMEEEPRRQPPILISAISGPKLDSQPPAYENLGFISHGETQYHSSSGGKVVETLVMETNLKECTA